MLCGTAKPSPQHSLKPRPLRHTCLIDSSFQKSHRYTLQTSHSIHDRLVPPSHTKAHLSLNLDNTSGLQREQVGVVGCLCALCRSFKNSQTSRIDRTSIVGLAWYSTVQCSVYIIDQGHETDVNMQCTSKEVTRSLDHYSTLARISSTL